VLSLTGKPQTSKQLLETQKPKTMKQLLVFTVFLACLLFAGCAKESLHEPEMVLPATNAPVTTPENSVLLNYTSIPFQTMLELQMARSHTARYRNIENAKQDGYVDIGVIVQGMGHHYLNPDLLDATFDPKKPEILVYRKDEDETFELVAVEYAIPLVLSANAPAGFYSNLDVWDRNTNFQLWLLHAWVWAYNPSGVFNPTNPSVHTH
jgi:hypothetical protein